jgi:hypothetical protein
MAKNPTFRLIENFLLQRQLKRRVQVPVKNSLGAKNALCLALNFVDF